MPERPLCADLNTVVPCARAIRATAWSNAPSPMMPSGEPQGHPKEPWAQRKRLPGMSQTRSSAALLLRGHLRQSGMESSARTAR